MSLRWSLKSFWDRYYKHAAPTELGTDRMPSLAPAERHVYRKAKEKVFKLQRSDIAVLYHF